MDNDLKADKPSLYRTSHPGLLSLCTSVSTSAVTGTHHAMH